MPFFYWVLTGKLYIGFVVLFLLLFLLVVVPLGFIFGRLGASWAPLGGDLGGILDNPWGFWALDGCHFLSVVNR